VCNLLPSNKRVGCRPPRHSTALPHPAPRWSPPQRVVWGAHMLAPYGTRQQAGVAPMHATDTQLQGAAGNAQPHGVMQQSRWPAHMSAPVPTPPPTPDTSCIGEKRIVAPLQASLCHTTVCLQPVGGAGPRIAQARDAPVQATRLAPPHARAHRLGNGGGSRHKVQKEYTGTGTANCCRYGHMEVCASTGVCLPTPALGAPVKCPTQSEAPHNHHKSLEISHIICVAHTSVTR
jgi:hypothetical protein